MIRRRTIAVLAVAAAIGGLGLASTPAFASEAGSDADTETRTTHVPVLLSEATTLSDAIDLGSDSDLKIVGYRFENDGVVGEYFPRGEEPSVFLEQFREDFGMDPRITSLVAEVVTSSDPANAGTEVMPQAIEVKSTSARSPFLSSRDGAMWEELKAGQEQAKAAGLVQDTSSQAGINEQSVLQPSARSTAVTLSWEPTFSRFALRNVGSSPQKASIFQEYTWSEPGYDPALRDLDTALEFEINEHNASALLWGGIRPNCVWNYKEHFWATNSGYTWGVFSPYGFASVGIGAYADTNDLSDPCARQSMAIGVSNPGNVNDDGYGFKQLGLWITANRGNVATDSHVSGVVQAVEKLSCNAWPWNGNISTDCVGLNQGYTYNGYGPSFFTTLNENRNVWAPEKCWLRSRVAQQWDPNSGPSEVYFGSCDEMFGPAN